MLPLNPQFTRYELVFTNSSFITETYSFYNSAIQIHLNPDTYSVRVNGYTGDVITAQSDVYPSITVSGGALSSPPPFVLKPYRGSPDGVLSYSLGWDGLSRMPYRAELLIEHYDTYPDWIPMPLSSAEITAGSGPGTILLLQRDAALVKLTGSLSLPAKEYRLTVAVTMNQGDHPVSRVDYAHVYSNLTTPAAFYYGGGDLLVSNTSPDPGVGFITGFTFAETPEATTVIGSAPGADGTRLIMIMVPSDADLTDLTPQVTCAEGSFITSPLPTTDYTGTTYNASYTKGFIDFSNPTLWTAQAKTGATQQYTVLVSKPPDTSTEARITYFFFENYGNYPGIIDEGAKTIHVILPYGTNATSLTARPSIIGKSVSRTDSNYSIDINDYSQNDTATSTPAVFTVTAADNSTTAVYDVTVDVADDDQKQITDFAIDGYPDCPGNIAEGLPGSEGLITVTLPYGVSLVNLKPLVQYRGKSLDPGTGVTPNFNVPVLYTVTADDNSTKTYRVVISNELPSNAKGIFDFWITNYSNCKVVIGQNPRHDGRIPIVIQVPPETDENDLIPGITLSPGAVIRPAPGIGAEVQSNAPIPFGNQGGFSESLNYQEALYRVTAQDGTHQDYVVVVSMRGDTYYVNGQTGHDDYPDTYNGQTEANAFKTLAYAVYRAAHESPPILKIFVRGELNDSTEGGAYENAAIGLNVDKNLDGFYPSGSSSGSVFTLNGTNSKKITVTGLGTNAALRGTSGKRVLSIGGEADLVFENITITGGNAPASSDGGNGGGVHISGSSKVKFSNASISGNTAVGSGGGIYVVDDVPNGYYDLTLVNSSVGNNTANGTARPPSTNLPDGGEGLPLSDSGGTPMGGGGGIYVHNYALAWLAGGSVTGNTTLGSGGGVMVNGRAEDSNTDGERDDEYGLLMSGGTIANNNSKGSVSPHGGGGVYVAAGAFEMLGGDISSNKSTRQGGGVFVWHDSRFSASGTSSITGNEGVGSSKAVCSRGLTELMGSARADKVYIWNNSGKNSFNQEHDSFILAENARVGGIALAYSPDNINFIIVTASGVGGTDRIALIDLEGHLTNGLFVDTDLNYDWLNKKVLDGTLTALSAVVDTDINTNDRYALNTFVGGSVRSLAAYYVDPADGKLKK
jgi:hypothetical protein